MPRLTAAQAANYLGIAEEDLLLSRMRGLPPGSLGWKEGNEVVWEQDDLIPPPSDPNRAQVERDLLSPPVVRSIEANQCPGCGFQAKSAAGLKTHRRAKGH